MDSQQLLAIAITMLASIYLVRRSVQSLRLKSGGCGSCATCPESIREAGSDNLPLRKQLYSLGDSKME